MRHDFQQSGRGVSFTETVRPEVRLSAPTCTLLAEPVRCPQVFISIESHETADRDRGNSNTVAEEMQSTV